MSDLSPYTQAMQECLANLDKTFAQAARDKSVVQFLTNMVQGRMLQHMVTRVSEFYHLQDPAFEEELSTLLIEVFKDEVFETFRQKLDEDPRLIFTLAHKIVNAETEESLADKAKTNHLYLYILRRYVGYDNLESLVATLQSHPQIQKLILSALLKKRLNSVMYQTIDFLLDQDRQDVATNVFILYGKNFYPLRDRFSKIGTKLKSNLTITPWKFRPFWD